MKQPIGLWGWLVRIAAVGYLVALVAVIVAFRFVGERWWVTAAVLYLPRIGFGLPLPFIALAVLFTRRGRRWLLATQAVALGLVLFPIMGLETGLHLPGRAANAGALHVRLMSYNVDSSQYGTDAILRQVRDARPDLVLLQEVSRNSVEEFRTSLGGDYTFRADGQFVVASRYPIEDVYLPPRISHQGKMRSPRFLRYRLVTPAGKVDVYNVHPISPREALDELHGDGLKDQILSGQIFKPAAAGDIVANAGLRVAQAQAIALEAERATGPVIIAGDTNLPQLSWGLQRWLGGFRDGFAEAGAGFGYTFPAPKHPWMRIDRVLANDRFRFVDFHVSRTHASDHLAVVAELELR